MSAPVLAWCIVVAVMAAWMIGFWAGWLARGRKPDRVGESVRTAARKRHAARGWEHQRDDGDDGTT